MFKTQIMRGLLCVQFIICISLIANAQTDISQLKAPHKVVLSKWLETQPGWNLKTERDYNSKCLSLLQKNAGKDYRPFYFYADFNDDNHEDFAVILVRGAKERYAIAIFNGPFKSKGTQLPSYFNDGRSIFTRVQKDDILLYNKPLGVLSVGLYGYDRLVAGFEIKADGNSYKAGSSFDSDTSAYVCSEK